VGEGSPNPGTAEADPAGTVADCTSPWCSLEAFDDASVPKLWNLRRAHDAGFVVPATVWASASALEGGLVEAPTTIGEGPWMVRSGSPTEDASTQSNAGRFLSLRVECAADFDAAVKRVAALLPHIDGRACGVVFVQPLVQAAFAGVTFFDGFYSEETRSQGTNCDLTAGRQRGDVIRGHLERGDAHSSWLLGLYGLLGCPIDLEWAQPAAAPDAPRVLLQARPALFPVRRSETLSLANHREILGDAPSPWIVGVIVRANPRIAEYLHTIEPASAAWDEPYAVELGGRAWINFSLFFRLMDHWGLPRALVTQGVGGEDVASSSVGIVTHRFLRMLPRLVITAFRDFAMMSQAPRGVRVLERQLEKCTTLLDLEEFNVRAMAFSVRTNLAIMMVLSVAARLRRALGVGDQAARLVSKSMIARHAVIAALPKVEDRLRGLDRWLKRYGYRGPLESDPSQPRFKELRASLRAALERGPASHLQRHARPSRLVGALVHPLFFADELREWFRDRLMRTWARMREKILLEAEKAVADGYLDTADDVFFLRREDLEQDPPRWRERVATGREHWQRDRTLHLPTTATRAQIEAAIAGRLKNGDTEPRVVFHGIGLGSSAVEGTAVCASDLDRLLNRKPLPDAPILVAPCLEPALGVAFPRFAAVVADLGGELSHAAILLRESGIPAVLNAHGASEGIVDGDRVCVDPPLGEVRIISDRNRSGNP
jgi:phosphohistidine swiveling domain-containing protein